MKSSTTRPPGPQPEERLQAVVRASVALTASRRLDAAQQVIGRLAGLADDPAAAAALAAVRFTEFDRLHSLCGEALTAARRIEDMSFRAARPAANDNIRNSQ